MCLLIVVCISFDDALKFIAAAGAKEEEENGAAMQRDVRLNSIWICFILSYTNIQSEFNCTLVVVVDNQFERTQNAFANNLPYTQHTKRNRLIYVKVMLRFFVFFFSYYFIRSFNAFAIMCNLWNSCFYCRPDRSPSAGVCMDWCVRHTVFENSVLVPLLPQFRSHFACGFCFAAALRN